MTWDPILAKKYIEMVGINHIRDDLINEGVDLIKSSEFPENFSTKEDFTRVFKIICCWEDDEIKEAAFLAMNPAFM